MLKKLLLRLKIGFINNPYLAVILTAAYILRIVLILLGGQNYHPDEVRYFRAAIFYYGIFMEHLPVVDVVKEQMLELPDHGGFFLINLIISPPQLIASYFLIGKKEAFLWLPAIMLASSSVASIGLVYGISRRVGANQREALIAALFMALANSMFYYARHLLNYDASMAMILLGLYVGLAPSGGWKQSALTGILIGFGVFTYYGHWPFAGLCAAIHIFYSDFSIKKILQRGITVFPGLILLPALYTAATLLLGLEPFISRVLFFSTLQTTGDFAEGWKIPYLYLWSAETGIFVVWMVGCLIALWLAIRRQAGWTRALLWVGCITALYLQLTIFSTVLHRTSTYARLVRPIVPFICLLAAYGYDHGLAKIPSFQRYRWAVAGLVIILAAYNLIQPLFIQYPPEILEQAAVNYETFHRINTVVDDEPKEYKTVHPFVDDPNSRYVVVNAAFFGHLTAIHPAPTGKILLQVPHPFLYKPYQYEGFPENIRNMIDESNLSILIIDQASN